MKPVVAITMGDVNGVGPEILAKALAGGRLTACCIPVVIGSPRVLEEARVFAPGCPPVKEITDIGAVCEGHDFVPVLDGGFSAPAVHFGLLTPEAGRCAVEWVKLATRFALEGVVGAIVTCPINKEGIHRAGYAYSGHTELIAELTSAHDYRMSLFTDTEAATPMRIVHITSHMSLRDALDAVKTDRIASTIRIAEAALVRLGLPTRRIAVAGLNPHAGEAGAFGTEETDEILPAIDLCRSEGIDCSGPYPPDTVFARMKAGAFDLVVALYHDQGHIPLKLVAMDDGVNVTLGLPIIRTSVDHGTAYDIAGKGIAREHSLCAAVRLAAAFRTRKAPQG